MFTGRQQELTAILLSFNVRKHNDYVTATYIIQVTEAKCFYVMLFKGPGTVWSTFCMQDV